MSASRAEELAQQLSSLQEQLASGRSELTKAKQKRKDSQRREWKLTPWLRHVVVDVYVLGGYSAVPAGCYLARAAARRCWEAKSEEDLQTIVEDAFLETGDQELELLTNEDNSTDQSALREAVRFLEEWRLAGWAKALNERQGVAATTDSTLRRYEYARLQLPESVQPRGAGPVTQSRGREWARRWRKRWGASYGYLRVREDVSADEIQEKAHAVWQWWNYAEGLVPSGKRPLRINLDETSVCLDQGGGRGVVFARRGARPWQQPARRVSRARRRTCLTHVGFICDVPVVQRVLPQIIIGNLSTFLVRDWAVIKAAAPENVYVLRQKSAWNNANLLCRIIRLLGQLLAPYANEFQPILLMDACKIHLADSVLAACAAAGVWPIIVPAKLTWLVQPCDTDAFHPYKALLKKVYSERKAGAVSGQLGVVEFLECMYEAIRRVLCERQWGLSFSRNGFGWQQAALSERVLGHLGAQAPPSLPADEPSADTVRLCFPRRSRAPCERWLGVPSRGPLALPSPIVPAALPAPAPDAPVAASASSSSGAGVTAVPAVSSREPRTRAEHRAARAAAAAAMP